MKFNAFSDFANIIDKMLAMTNLKLKTLSIYRKTWASQIKDAMNVNGGDVKNATATDYVLHFISFNWKVLFSFIPPPSMFRGWLCFFVSLCAIGFVTAVIEDIASLFGCVVGLKDTITGNLHL